MARTDKVATLEALEAGFRESNAALLTEYRGLTVAQLKKLRRSLAGEAEYAVVKNTLTKLAASRAGVEGLDDLLAGPSAVAFVKGDAVSAAKALKAFSKEHPLLVIKGGYFDGKVLTAAEVQKLADLESREVLLSKAVGAMVATMSKAAVLFQAPLSKTVRTVEALRAAAEADPSIIAGAGVAAPAAEPAAEVVEEAVEAPAEAAEAIVEESTAAEAPAEAEVEAADAAETTEG